MSNYTKSFNFQNGVQVDDDNFVVTQGGLVGIGTSVPSKTLDVRGNADISGILTTSGVNVGAAVSVGANIIIDAASGIITATKFVGDAGNLNGIVAIATDGFVQQAGSLSTTAKVGIKTDNPVFDLQIGSNPRNSTGVGITNGDVLISGVTTVSTKLVVTGLTTTHDLIVRDELNVLGVSTFADKVQIKTGILPDEDEGAYIGSSVKPFSEAHIGEIRIANSDNDGEIDTASGNLTLDSATGQTIIDDNLDVVGITTFSSASTFSGDIITGVGATVGIGTNVFFDDNVKVVFGNSSDFSLAHNTTVTPPANQLTSDIDSEFEIISDNLELRSGTGDKSYLTATVGSATTLFFNNIKRLETTDSGVDVSGSLNITGISTFSSKINVGSSATVGFGTHVFFNDNAKAVFGNSNEVVMFHKPDTNDFRTTFDNTNLILLTDTFDLKNEDGSKAAITANNPGGVPEVRLHHDGIEKFKTIGAGVSVFNELQIASLNGGTSGLSTYFASLRYGNENEGFPYSTRRSLDLVNNDSGSVNFYLDANLVGVDTGNFNWFRGANTSPLLTLTNQGSLGIGVTDPEFNLQVGGSSSIGGNLSVEGNQSVFGAANVTDDLTIGGNLNVSSINSNLTGNVTGDLAGNVFTDSGISTFAKVGINTTIITESVALDCISGNAAFRRIGIGSTQPDCILDVSDVVGVNTTKKFILLPLVSAGQTAELTSESTLGGGFIYNTSLRKLQFYNGTEWETVTSVVL
tara:strand:+ start:28774 stop:31014 length:2241 start_codon:yes stop_codon:yes gene_type:complete